MPRFQFRWHHFSPDLLEIIAEHANIRPPTAAAFESHVGPEPSVAFVANVKSRILAYWLHSEPSVVALFVQMLRTHGLGNLRIKNPAKYVASCQVAPQFDALLHQVFVTKGQQPYDTVKIPRTATMAPTALPHADATAIAQMYTLVHDTLHHHLPPTLLTLTSDGAFAIIAGSCIVHVNVQVTPRVVRIHAALVVGVTASPALYESLNSINSQLPMGRMFYHDGTIYIESSLVEATLTEKSLMSVVSHIAGLADSYDDRLQHTFGGKLIREIAPKDQIDA